MSDRAHPKRGEGNRPRHYPDAVRPAPLPDADCAECGEQIVASRSVNDTITWCHEDVPARGHRARPIEVGTSARTVGNVPQSQRQAAVASFDAAARRLLAGQVARDDLARDVAREWTPGAMMADAARGVLRQDYPKLIAALDRLAAAYGETP